MRYATIGQLILFLSACSTGTVENTAVLPALSGTGIFQDSVVHVVEIFCPRSDFFDELGKKKNLKDSLDVTEYVLCDVVIDGEKTDSAGVRFKGEASYSFAGKKKSFKIKFNEFVKGKRFRGYKAINLNNCFKDPSFLREKLALDIMASSGLPSQQAAFSKLYINGAYYGLYLLVEEVDAKFLKRVFKSSGGNLYAGKPNGLLKELSTENDYLFAYRKENNKNSGYHDLISLIEKINADPENFSYSQNLDSMINMDELLTGWAINNIILNVDAYNMIFPHNYYLYFDSTSMKFRWINTDFNYAFGGWSPSLNYHSLVNFDIHQADSTGDRVFLNNVLLNESLRIRYDSAIHRILNDQLNVAAIKNRIDFFYGLIRDHVFTDSLKSCSNRDFEKNMYVSIGDTSDPGAFTAGLKSFLHDRDKALKKQLGNH